MAWLRLSDNFATNPVVLNVCRNRGEKTRVLGMITELMLYAASHMTDGYIPEVVFRDVVRSPRWREILTGPANGGTALIHRPGDKCECMINPVAWPDTAADYYLHHYLQWNPSREENDVARAKQAELRDRELAAIVKKRDRDRCRYCDVRVVWNDRRSSVGGVLDHVDPALAAGAVNLVVACRGCNSRKGARTPAGAGMTLREVPGTDLSQGSGGDQTRTNRSASGRTTHVPVRDGTGRGTEFGPPVETSGDQAEPEEADGTAAGPGSGGIWSPDPIGDQPRTGPATTPRTSRHPNPYRRPGMTGLDPLDHAGLPSVDDIDAALGEHNAFTQSEQEFP